MCLCHGLWVFDSASAGLGVGSLSFVRLLVLPLCCQRSPSEAVVRWAYVRSLTFWDVSPAIKYLTTQASQSRQWTVIIEVDVLENSKAV